MKILVNRFLGEENFQKIRDLGYDLLFIPEKELSDREDIHDIDVWFTYYGFEKADITKMKNLKYIHTTSTGINQVPVEYVLKNNIILSNNKTGYAIPMAESIVMYILEVYKNSHQMFKQQENKQWKMDMSWTELAGKRVGFIGTGNISKETAKRLKPFNIEIWGTNTNGRDIEFFDKCFPLNESDEFFSSCDIIIGLMPSTGNTTGLIGEKEFELMKDNSVVMNIGRGNLFNEDALVKYAPKFKGIVLDVVQEEPLCEESPLWDLENIIITPHNSWVSENNIQRLFERLYENLKSFIETGKPKTYIEDITRGY